MYDFHRRDHRPGILGGTEGSNSLLSAKQSVSLGTPLQDAEIARDCSVICRFGGTGEDHLSLVRAQDAAKVSVGE